MAHKFVGSVGMISDPLFEQIRARLITEFQPVKMYLFGSRAAGNARPTSDYDIVLVVKERQQSRVENMITAARLVRDLGASVDVLVYSESEFENWKSEMNSIPEVALTEGREIPLG